MGLRGENTEKRETEKVRRSEQRLTNKRSLYTNSGKRNESVIPITILTLETVQTYEEKYQHSTATAE